MCYRDTNIVNILYFLFVQHCKHTVLPVCAALLACAVELRQNKNERKPASLKTLKRVQLESIAVLAGFPFPMRVGVAERFPPMAVKLKGEMAATKPSRPRYITRFHTLRSTKYLGVLYYTSVKYCNLIGHLWGFKSLITLWLI